MTMEPLTEKERKFVALAIFTMAMKAGDTSFETVGNVVEKIGLEKEFEFYAKDWLAFSRMVKNIPRNGG